MKWPARLLAVVGAFALAFGLCGCSASAGRSWEVSNGSTSQRDDGAMYSYGSLALTRDSQVYFVLATARGTGNSYAGGEGKYQGELHASDGVKIAWSCTTQDGQSGRVAIDNQEFDLTAGAMFLVSTKDKSTHVQQLKIDRAQLQTCSDVKKLLGVLKANPQMATFLELCKASE